MVTPLFPSTATPAKKAGAGTILLFVVAALIVLGTIGNMLQEPLPTAIVNPDATVTRAQIADAESRVQTAIKKGIILRYDCGKQFAYVDGVSFAMVNVDTKAGMGATLMTACGVAPKIGTFTLIDQQSGKPLMRFTRGRFEAQ